MADHRGLWADTLENTHTHTHTHTHTESEKERQWGSTDYDMSLIKEIVYSILS
jgi:hypothetical protein